MSQIHKPAENDDREIIHKAENEVSAEGPPSTSEVLTPDASAGIRSFLEVLPRESRDVVYYYTFEHVAKQHSDEGDDVTYAADANGHVSSIVLLRVRMTSCGCAA